MINKILKLPISVQVVCWINFAMMILGGVSVIASFHAAEATENLSGILSVSLNLLILAAILERSKTIRMLILIFSWVNLVLLGIGLSVAFSALGIAAFMMIIPLLVNGITIWGLTTPESRFYFGIIKKEVLENHQKRQDNETLEIVAPKELEPYVALRPKHNIQPGMSLSEVSEVLGGRFILESEQIVGFSDEGKITLYTFCDARNSSNLFRFEAKNGIVGKIH